MRNVTLLLAAAYAMSFPAIAVASDMDCCLNMEALREIDPQIVQSAAFEEGHPDMRLRRLGVQARGEGRLEHARTWFRRAGRFGDKLSQAAYAEMLWEGEGGEAEPILAYVWMDLAAERGAPMFLTLRERYWRELDAGQREQALAQGVAVYAEYGDEAALPRLERRMRRIANNVTGSRTGWVGTLDIYLGLNADGTSDALVSGDRYFADRYWDPEAYRRWQDELLRTPPAEGRVDVGELEPVRQEQGDDD